MLKHLMYLCAIAFVLSAAGYVDLGLDWIYVGYGLNPWLSFPVAVFCGVMAIVSAIFSLRLHLNR